MAQCVVCAQLCTIWCAHDKAFLCTQCDSTIHTANVISRNHKRLPVCELCKRAPASVYCHEDAAALCSGCEVEVHSANPLPHTVVPVEQAMTSGAVKSPGLAFVVASPAATATPVALVAPQQRQGPAEDEVSACGGGAVAPDAAQLCSSEGNTSLAVVPDILAPQASAHAPAQLSASAAALAGKDTKAMWGGDFDALDFEAAWLTGLDGGLDFTDILGNDAGALDVPGTVPTAPVVPEPVQPVVPAVPMPAFAPEEEDLLAPVGEDDFVVPSFLPEDLEEELQEAVHPASAHMLMSGKRPLELADLATPPPKALALEVPSPHAPAPLPTPVPQQPAQQHYYHLAAPAPPPPVVSKPAPQQSSPRSAAALLDGANLTREQRVARYREKRKNRTFQKTIRYASRKAYAEVRPRIKGRFATKEEVEAWKAAQAAGTVGPNEPFRLLI